MKFKTNQEAEEFLKLIESFDPYIQLYVGYIGDFEEGEEIDEDDERIEGYTVLDVDYSEVENDILDDISTLEVIEKLHQANKKIDDLEYEICDMEIHYGINGMI